MGGVGRRGQGEGMRGAGRDGNGRGGEVDSDAQLEQGRRLAKAGHAGRTLLFLLLLRLILLNG